ncbi:MAG: hypothetical protein ABH883_06045 [Candidatus Omnitrophota bacterium]
MMNRRKKYLINKPIQFQIAAMAIIPAFLATSFLYFIINYFISREIMIPEFIVRILLPTLKKVNITLIAITPIALFILFRTILYNSNKITGPLYRLEKDLEKIIETNDFSLRVKFREKDHLHSLAVKTNKLLEKLQANNK